MNSTILDISVIIPFKDRARMTLECVNSLLKYGPGIKEILLVSNNSSETELNKIKKGIEQLKNTKVIEYNHPFNYQKINNWAVRQSSGNFIFFLNNDTEFIDKSIGLIERMHEKASEDNVGIVGCLMLYGDKKTIQHAGVYLKPGLLGEHLYVGQPLKKVFQNLGTKQYPYDITKPLPMTAVTGAAQVIERKKFDSVGGFDEKFIVCGGDVDLCIRLNKKGLQTWYVGTKNYIIHKESQSRSYKPVPFNDFYCSYISYSQAFDNEKGDPHLSKITESMS